jgi:hypothetical protein
VVHMCDSDVWFRCVVQMCGPDVWFTRTAGELLWRLFGKDLGEFGNIKDDVTFVQPHLQKGLERRIHSSRGDVFMNRQDESE